MVTKLSTDLREKRNSIYKGGQPEYHQRLKEKTNDLFVIVYVYYLIMVNIKKMVPLQIMRQVTCLLMEL